MSKHYFAEFSSSAVNRESALISGVSIISTGEAKGHTDFDTNGNPAQVYIDGTTLDMVAQLIAGFGDEGIKVKVDHWSGFDGIVGTIHNCSIVDGKIRGDLQLLESHPAKDRILEMAESMPSQFGLSISFSGQNDFGALKDSDGNDVLDGEGKAIAVAYARPSELFSVDLVDAPAANATGLFSAKESELVRELSDLREQVKALDSARTELAAANTKITDLQSKLTEKTEEMKRVETLYSSLKKAANLGGANVIPQVSVGTEAVKSIREQYAALKGKEKREFRRLHWAELIRPVESLA
jgi:hypothetical protein